ncbi:uncharacterized protein METZ01_LOCUS133755 [marine metagenome]|uniref:Uncharacterized protein n=1 Tax=marine metagenome TaxID=408172 RepID=A0A381YWA7_9ZZZZ
MHEYEIIEPILAWRVFLKDVEEQLQKIYKI